MTVKEFQKFFEDEEFARAFVDLNTKEEMRAVFARKGIDLPTEVCAELFDLVERCRNNELTEQEQRVLQLAQKENNGEELSDEELEMVSGGFLLSTLIAGMFIFGIPAGVVGLIVAGVVCKYKG